MTVNLSPFAGAGSQFFDNNGVILSGGLMYTYAAGTTTPQTTYNSSSGAAANTNPIVLDSAGRTTSEIWLTSNLSYKFVLNTSLGITIGTYDDISSVQGSVVTDITALQADVTALQAADATFALKGANTDITSLASPALGAATATTQALGDSSTKVATTAFAAKAGGSQIQSISASVAASALTISASALTLVFRSNNVSDGAVTTLSGTPANLVVPSGATLGTANLVQSRLIVLALNPSGTIELAVVNVSGGVNLTETGTINTTAISAGSTSASVVYSTTARSSVPYRVIGYIESTQVTAGTWATVPSTIQGEGGQALAALNTLGYGQTWQIVTRTAGTTYTNSTGKPIVLQVSAFCTTGSNIAIFCGGLTLATYQGATASPIYGTISAIIPNGNAYGYTSTGAPTTFNIFELR